MTYKDFIEKVQQPQQLNAEQIQDFKVLIEKYPYFNVGRWLYLKALYNSNSIYFGQELKRTAVHSSNRRNLYFFIHPEELNTAAGTTGRNGNSSGSYFDMLDTLQNKGENNRMSLRSLAERLKAAREMLHTDTSKPEQKLIKPDEIITKPEPKAEQDKEIVLSEKSTGELEEEAKKYIKEKKYQEAIVILKELNFNNPKKSIYFADQIRFLEKIIQNNTK